MHLISLNWTWGLPLLCTIALVVSQGVAMVRGRQLAPPAALSAALAAAKNPVQHTSLKTCLLAYDQSEGGVSLDELQFCKARANLDKVFE